MKTADEIARAAGGSVVAGSKDAAVTSWAFDSRALERGACFVAVRGDRDGGDFVADAFDAGAHVALVSRPSPPIVPPAGAAVVEVDDSLLGLQAVARADRRARSELRVVGVTGSTGKTSTKDLLAAMLAPLGCYASPASHNNEFGLPITLLNAPADVSVVVAEMGERFAGDIAALCEIARPETGVVTNVGLAHAEHLGGPEGAARVLGELIDALPAGGLAVLNADDEWTPSLLERATSVGVTAVTVGRSAGADYRIEGLELDAQLHPEFVLHGQRVVVPLHGEHQASNAALALVVAHRGFDIALDAAAASMAAARPAPWRLQLQRHDDGVVVLNDAYNANPTSLDAALRALAQVDTGGRRIAILGDMRELGPYADDAHAAVGRRAAELNIDIVIGVGAGGRLIAEAASGLQVRTATDAADALRIAVEIVEPGDAVLVKASRAVGLEIVAAGLLSRVGSVAPQRGAPS
ncbi:MAG: UDP-N-acetylmuramoyl-tripeptide--D-alanyl-D-alanine ligase [Actinomycetota bacterium]|nr:UDP-N-acetylmuramoyl-tripeptide--D-alanyl-D-alanine ligase [Actinomycetota bacterium]